MKNLMLCIMAKSGVWPVMHIESLALFYANLEMHKRVESDLGKQALFYTKARSSMSGMMPSSRRKDSTSR